MNPVGRTIRMPTSLQRLLLVRNDLRQPVRYRLCKEEKEEEEALTGTRKRAYTHSPNKDTSHGSTLVFKLFESSISLDKSVSKNFCQITRIGGEGKLLRKHLHGCKSEREREELRRCANA